MMTNQSPISLHLFNKLQKNMYRTNRKTISLSEIPYFISDKDIKCFVSGDIGKNVFNFYVEYM